MSATAMHAAGQHAQIPTTSSYPASSTTRQYIQSGNDESYYMNQDLQPTAPYSSSRQHRRNNTEGSPDPSQHLSSNRDEEYIITRHAPVHQTTTTTTTTSLHGRTQSATLDQYDGPPQPPPRTSSQQQNSPHAAVDASRQAKYRTDRSPGQHSNMAGTYADASRDRPRDDSSTTAAAAARNRRKNPSSPEGPQRAASTRERGQQSGLPAQSRSEATMLPTGPPAPLIRENSEIINRVVVSDPQVDIERMQERVAEAQPAPLGSELSPTIGTQSYGETGPGPQRRQDYSKSSSKRKDVQFGDYVLGQTLGEGEFGKVKLGWKRDGSTQVAIKLIRRESVATNPTRLPKIYREISILRDLAHPNIVRLHEMVETERHIGIILEYASGGELFDFILNQRYLKDPQARRLFAQLVSGVGYLHKKGIVHRDLKLENLLLDQNRNIIITDFGFANTFNPADDLSPEIEYNLGNKDFVRKYKLDRLDANGMRKGDLMQTSCGSPCYAAPELVVSDSLYTGKKVDVWSCGVILYAMLAGYLPFDDDPANPEGDNINLLYKYITTTPLTFPEYVSPHARDLLRRILVPDPRKRADLFEVARHSWLNEYHHVVAHITSSTTNIADIANSTVGPESEDANLVPRSASVRVPKTTPPHPAAQSSSAIEKQYQQTPAAVKTGPTRHTLQPEYVAPQTQTARVQPTEITQGVSGVPHSQYSAPGQSISSKQLPPDPPRQSPDYAQPSMQATTQTGPVRPGRNVPRAVSDNAALTGVASVSQPAAHATRPSTQGSLTSASGPTTRSDLRLPSRGSYGQPVAPTVAATNVQGKVTQPAPAKSSKAYNISGPLPQQGGQSSMSQPMTQPMPPPEPLKGHHRRSSTLSNLGERLFGRSNSVSKKNEDRQKNGRKYPPTAMKDSYSSEPQPRMSTDSKRSFSFGLKRKESADMDQPQSQQQQQQSQHHEEKPRRFSLLPSSISFRGLMGGNRDHYDEQAVSDSYGSSQQSTRPQASQNYAPTSSDGQQEMRPPKINNFSRPPQGQYRHQYSASTNDVYGGTGVYASDQGPPQAQSSHQRQQTHHIVPQFSDNYNDPRQSMQSNRPGKNVLTKPNRKFNDAYGNEITGHGSSGAVKKVQDFFRRRGRARIDSDYR